MTAEHESGLVLPSESDGDLEQQQQQRTSPRAAVTHISTLAPPGVVPDAHTPFEDEETAHLTPKPSGADSALGGSQGYSSVAPASSSSSSSPSSPSGPCVVIAFINFHSGGKTGKMLAGELIQALGSEFVFDLKGDRGPSRGLRLFKGTPNLRVVIGGGDGTINWVLSQMRQEGMADVPTGCIPLGTGNDASRAFGWGFKYPGVKKVKANIDRMRSAKPDTFMKYDRWHALVQYDTPADDEWVESLPASVRAIRKPEDIPTFYTHPQAVSVPPAAEVVAPADAHPDLGPSEPLDPHAAERGAGAQFGSEWNNYLSWGVDAQIQSAFHDQRESCRCCFCCRPCNMAWMGLFGATNFLCCQGSELDVHIEVRDSHGQWVHVPLPPGLRSIVLLNTPTYAGGRFLWGRDNPHKPKPPRAFECAPQRQSADDGLFEIVGVRSTFHLGMVMAQVSRGIRLAQVNEARITFGTGVIAQADGEPWMDKPGTYHIRPLVPATMMTVPHKVVRP